MDSLADDPLDNTVDSPMSHRRQALRVSAVQAAVLLALCVALGLQDPVLARSALLGGLIAVLPQLWFACRLFPGRGAEAAHKSSYKGPHKSYVAEAGKVALTAAGFAAVFATVRPLSAGAVFAAFGLMTVIHLLGAWFMLRASADSKG